MLKAKNFYIYKKEEFFSLDYLYTIRGPHATFSGIEVAKNKIILTLNSEIDSYDYLEKLVLAKSSDFKMVFKKIFEARYLEIIQN